MGITPTFVLIVLGVSAFAAWCGYRQAELIRKDEEDKLAAAREASIVVPMRDKGRCVLCHSPLPRPVTREEVVSEIEKRISAEMAVVNHFLAQPAPELLRRDLPS